MKATMPIEATKRQMVTRQQVTDALKSLDESVKELERVVLDPNNSQSETLGQKKDVK